MCERLLVDLPGNEWLLRPQEAALAAHRGHGYRGSLCAPGRRAPGAVLQIRSPLQRALHAAAQRDVHADDIRVDYGWPRRGTQAGQQQGTSCLDVVRLQCCRFPTGIKTSFPQAFAERVQKLVQPIVSSTVQLFLQLTVELLPTPAKSHYTFNLRDVSKVFQAITRRRGP